MKSFLLICFSTLCVGCSGLQSIIKVERPTAQLQGIRFDEITTQSAGLLFDIEIKNPYPVDLPLLNMTYAVDTSGNKLFEGKADIQKSIPARKKGTVTLPAKIAYLDIVNAIKSYSPGASIPYNANVGLSFDAPALGIIDIPMSKSGELAVPSLSDINWRDLLNNSSKKP